MNTLLKYKYLIALIVGVVMRMIPALEMYGALFLYLIIPVLMVTSLKHTKTQLLSSTNKYAKPFLITYIITLISGLAHFLFVFLHLLGGGELLIWTILFTALTVIIGLIYIYHNKFTATEELALVILPIVLVFYSVLPSTMAPQSREGYAKAIMSHYRNEVDLMKALPNDCSLGNDLYEWELEIIQSSGGVNEEGKILGFYNEALVDEYRTEILKNYSLTVSQEESIQGAKYLGELLLCLAQIRNQLIVEKCL